MRISVTEIRPGMTVSLASVDSIVTAVSDEGETLRVEYIDGSFDRFGKTGVVTVL